MTTFMRAAAAVGLGCCPISAVRDRADVVSELLELPERVIPLAGLCVGWPAEDGQITPRLGLEATMHEDRFRANDLARQIDAYDRRRACEAPLSPPARSRSLGRGRLLRLVRGQGAASTGPSRCAPTSVRSCAPKASGWSEFSNRRTVRDHAVP